jgi:hypothetical protein
MSIYQMGTFGGLALGSWFWGAIAEVVGVSLALGLSSICLFTAILAGLRFPLVQPDPRLVEPGTRRGGRDLQLSQEDASAPVTITVEYRVDEGDRNAFMMLMRRRRQVMLRHGGNHWSLSQDADDPALWSERFGRASWTEFLRHRDRRTIEEEQTFDAVLKLHRGAKPPKLRYFIERDLAAETASLPFGIVPGDPRWG